MTAHDPFERAVQHERRFLQRRLLRTQRDATRFMTLMQSVFLGGWAVVLVAHGWLAGTDGAVFQVHAVVFALGVAAALAMQVMFRIVGRWGWLGDDDVPL